MKGHEKEMKGTKMVLAAFIKGGDLEKAIEAAEHLGRELTADELEIIIQSCLCYGFKDRALKAAKLMDAIVVE